MCSKRGRPMVQTVERFCSTVGHGFRPVAVLPQVRWTLKASYRIAQGKRSGAAAKRHPGLRSRSSVSTLKGSHRFDGTLTGFNLFLQNLEPRAALRLPWAVLSNRFAVVPPSTLAFACSNAAGGSVWTVGGAFGPNQRHEAAEQDPPMI